MLEAERVTQHLERGVIEVAPLAFMRGRTLNDSFIILDEAQNTSPEQMKMFLTRLGFNSKVVVTGDITQIDLPARAGVGTRRRQRDPRRARGDRVRPLRRGGRRPPQARAQDRRRLHRAHPASGARAPARPPAHDRCSISRCSGSRCWDRRRRARSRSRELCVLALSSAGIDDGHMAVEFVDEERIQVAQPRVPPDRQADRRPLLRGRRGRRCRSARASSATWSSARPTPPICARRSSMGHCI